MLNEYRKKKEHDWLHVVNLLGRNISIADDPVWQDEAALIFGRLSSRFR